MTLSTQTILNLVLALAVIALSIALYQRPSVSANVSAVEILDKKISSALEDPVAIDDSAVLAERLGISASRASAIFVGAEGLNNLSNGGVVGGLSYHCTGTSCTCVGDFDCNDMFTGACKSPSSNGSCTENTGEIVTCSCNPRN